MPLLGDGGWWSFVHVEDAASATVAAIEHGRPGGIYNIVDDEPARVRDWLPVLSGILGAKPPLHVPAGVARPMARGGHMVSMMTEVRAGSNAKAKQELGWRPAYSSWPEEFAMVARQTTEKAAA
jgi:nucleoside-diphosphate-sugar epimerase